MSSAPSPITTHPRLVDFTRQFVQPPGALYVSRDDNVTFRYGSNATDSQARVLMRYLHPTDGILYWRHDVTSELGRDPVRRQASAFEGFLLGLNVELLFGGTGGVWHWASVQLGREPGGLGVDFHALCHGYFSSGHPLLWPGGHYRDPWDGAGFRLVETQADPAAGTTFSSPVPESARRRLQSLSFELVTDAAAANRRVLVTARSQTGTIYCRSASANVQTASQTQRYHVAPWGENAGLLGSEVMMNWPSDLILRNPDEVAVTAENLQAGDNFGAPTFLWEEWFEFT